MTNLKVAVRIRPMSDREISAGTVSSVSVDNGILSVTNIKVPEHHAGDSRERVRKFAFDYCYDQDTPQEELFAMIENEISSALSNKYHSCVLAYGQSSTGKTYTMMGTQDDPGLTPKLCENVFTYLGESDEEDQRYLHTYVSYLEIYNERVCDLLTFGNNSKTLKVREHPKKGPYVQGLSEHPVRNSEELLSWLATGNGNRRVASTLNNRRSSRSHSVFTVTLSSARGRGSAVKLHLVDLAGSERASVAHRGFNAPRLKEGANINRSLVALGNVICALSDSSSKYGRTCRKRFVPYRDSILTWLLKETLGGNSKTIMIATISPASSCYSETVNTLRFGQRAKQIVNVPIVNEDAQEKIIRELRAEIYKLRELLKVQNISNVPSNRDEVVPATIMTEPSPPIEPSSEDNTSPPTPVETSAQVNTETLIPVIDFTSSVEPKATKTPRLNRTLSVEFPKSIVKRLGREFGSHETLPKSRKVVQPSSSSRLTSLTQKVKSSATNLSEKSSTSRSGSISESSEISIPKSTKRINNTHTEIVASVTKRLFGQIKKKEISGSCEKLQTTESRDATKMRLQELTQKALRANRRKVHSDTQTDEPSILRFKEKSTDMQDIKLTTDEMKDVSTDTLIKMVSVGVDCQMQIYSQSIKLTSTCSTQTDDQPKLPNHSVSFTKYLQDSPLNIHSFAQPIYTSSVNINVSHNYPHNSKDEISDDSLEGNAKHAQFSTPDLISNHNSLETNCTAPAKSTGCVSEEKQFSQAASKLTEPVSTCECFNDCSKSQCMASSSMAVPIAETATSAPPPLLYAPETRINDIFTEKCSVIGATKAKVRTFPVCETVKARVCTVHHKPFTLKSIIKPTQESSSESETDHSLCARKLHCHKRKDMMKVITNFLDEASALLLNLNVVAQQVEHREKSRHAINQLKLRETVKRVCRRETSVQTHIPLHDAWSQTKTNIKLSSWSQTVPVSVQNNDRLEAFPENKWEKILEESCDTLENYLKHSEPVSKIKKTCSAFSESMSLPQNVTNFTTDPEWRYCSDYSSLDTMQSASDYGSLPRRDASFRRSLHKQNSPRAYLKQLVEMRKKIIENTRNDLMSEINLTHSE